MKRSATSNDFIADNAKQLQRRARLQFDENSLNYANKTINVLPPTNCRICLQIFIEPYVVFCGHTFCRECIIRHLENNNKCPLCEVVIDVKKYKLVPNFTADDMLKESQKNKQSLRRKPNNGNSEIESILETVLNSDSINLNNLEVIQKALKKRQKELLVNSEKMQKLLLQEFLLKMIEKRERSMENLQLELRCLHLDLTKINNLLRSNADNGLSMPQRIVPDSIPSISTMNTLEDVKEAALNDVEDMTFSLLSQNSASSDTFSESVLAAEEFLMYRRRMLNHINSLENVYLNQRVFGPSNVISPTNLSTSSNSSGSSSLNPSDDFENFTNILRGMSQYTSAKRLATLNYCPEAQGNHSSIVSSIEFDKDGEYFVIAGVTKRIKIYDYNSVVSYQGENSYPHTQLQCGAKISNVSWNPYHKTMLASSDYNGTVQVWDTAASKATRTLKEHQKRAWTVQFNNVDPHLMASGSDDAKVKLWNIFVPNSILTIDAQVNVCCVYFSPKSKNHLVFGSADHCVHLYDIRNTSKALRRFEGHKKAVSYVKYVNESQVISASTDSNLRLWDVNTGTCLQTMRGHINEKNFVGLATDGQHMICGSENNKLYLYYKHMAEPLLTFDFATAVVDNLTAGMAQTPVSRAQTPNVDSVGFSPSLGTAPLAAPALNTNSTDVFVSAVCWKKNSRVVLAANSHGTTHILQLK